MAHRARDERSIAVASVSDTTDPAQSSSTFASSGLRLLPHVRVAELVGRTVSSAPSAGRGRVAVRSTKGRSPELRFVP